MLPLAWAHALTVAAVKEDGRGSGEHVVRAAVGLGTHALTVAAGAADRC